MKRYVLSIVAVLLVAVMVGCSGKPEPVVNEPEPTSQEDAVAVLVELGAFDGDAVDAYNRGNAYHDKGEFDKAIENYTEAIRLTPESVETYYNRGIAYGKKGEMDKAIEDFTEAIRLNPELAEAYHSRGRAYRYKGDQTKAEADFAKAKELGYEPE